MDCFDECNKNKSIFFNISLPAVTLMLKNLHQLSFLIFMIIIFYEYQESLILFTKSLENQFFYPYIKLPFIHIFLLFSAQRSRSLIPPLIHKKTSCHSDPDSSGEEPIPTCRESSAQPKSMKYCV